jgi:hypothetical protein
LGLGSAAAFASSGRRFRELASLEDPAEDVLCEEVLGPGGAFLVGSGSSEQSVFALKLLSRALFQHTPVDAALVDDLVDLFRIALAISDRTLRAAGLSRGAVREGAPRQPVKEPPDGSRLLEAVTISLAENPELPLLLAPLLQRLGDAPPAAPSAARPFVLADDRLIVAYPFEIASALRHYAAKEIIGRDLENDHSARLVLAAFSILDVSMRRLGMTPLGPVEDFLPTKTAPDLPGGEALYRFDDGKLAHTLLIVDDLSGYDREVLFQVWDAEDVEARAHARVQQVREHLLRRPDVDVVHSLLVVAPLDRGMRVSVPGSLQATFMPLRDLDTFACAHANDPLALWTLARAIDNLTALGQVVSFSPLDLDQFLRESDYDIPVVDQPTLVVARPGGGGILREDQARRLDVHPVPHPSGMGVEVERWLRHAPRVPIYLPRESPWQEFECLLEGDDLYVWVVGPDSEAGQAIGHAAAYWLWQALPDISLVAPQLVDANDTLLVRLDLEPAERWRHESDRHTRRRPVLTAPFAYARGSNGSTTLVLTESAWWELQAADNAGERELLRHLLRHLLDGVWDRALIDEIVEKRAPQGYKKQLILGSGHDTRLSMRGLPREFRAVEAYDRARARELLSNQTLAEHPHLAGAIVDREAQELLHSYVGVAYRELSRRLRGFGADDVLERLILLNERLVQEQAQLRTTALTNVLAYGDVDESLQHRDVTDSRVSEAAIATRFLIELAATCPPQGTKRFSLADFDGLLALAVELIDAGRVADAIYFGLGEPDVTVAEGRLLFWPGSAVVESLASFNAELRESELAAGDVALEELVWRPPPQLVELPREIDDAVTAELGVSLSEIAIVLNTLVDHGIETEAGVVTATVTEVTSLFRQAGLSDEAQIAVALDRFSLSARDDFLHPADPDRASDVYPWRANRSLSLIRRPLVRRGDTLLYGIRHLYNAHLHLIRLIEAGRFPARTPKLKTLQGTHGRLLGRSFEDAVADLFERHGYPTRVRVRQLQGRPVAGGGQDLGDIDVLVADEPNERLLVIDAKNLGVALNADDLLRQSEQLLGSRNSAVTRTRARADWLLGNRDAAAAELANSAIGGWTVEVLVVTDRVLPAAHLSRGEARVISYGLLKRQLSEQRLAPPRQGATNPP